ncbi:hypothetical protein Leryth_004517 [Lithospermum erythrorhizon]|nr:hypothetical protein Leryth_004517 [Lithospermum erythrorhizon]
MYFSGDPSSRKRVDLGGRSSKERDRKKLLEQTRLERERRLWQRKQNSAAIVIQRCFRGRKVVERERSKVRESFFNTYGKHCEHVTRYCFGPDSDFLRQLLFFNNPKYVSDFAALVKISQLLQDFVHDSGDIVSLFAGTDYSSKRIIVEFRVKKLALICIQTVYENRFQWISSNLMECTNFSSSARLLLEAVTLLIDPKLPWSCSTVSHLFQWNIYSLFRQILLTTKMNLQDAVVADVSPLDRIIALVISHLGQTPCVCKKIEPHQSFSSQILSIPFLWRTYPHLKEIFSRPELSQYYFGEMALCVKDRNNVLPNDVAADLPGYACLLGNILEAAGVAFSHAVSFDAAVDFATISTYLLEAMPPLQASDGATKELIDDDMNLDDDMKPILNKNLEQQICDSIDPRFLQKLTNILLGSLSPSKGKPQNKGVEAVGAVCALLHVIFNVLPLERNMTVLAYRTELVPVLWKFMKSCHENQKWSSLSEQSAYVPPDSPGWLLPLAVFCPVYRHMLMIVDNEEFYEHEKPLPLNDIRLLIVILRQALWQLLWLNPVAPPNIRNSNSSTVMMKKHPHGFLQQRVCIVASELMSQLQDWNNRRQFTPPNEFQADGVDDHFIAQAIIEGTRANDILKQASFLVPFTSRAKIFTSQLTAAKAEQGAHSVFSRTRFRIRRDRILEDSFDQLNTLSEEDLRGQMRISFINEFGVEEAGIDGGGIFKDFMENISRAAFDVQYGLFKETANHLLYPNPGSGLVHEQHLQYFHFLGTILAKAMFEGILVDIPFATFFLSKLKQKHNYLNDLPSLDPELYRHLLFLKHYENDISELELYFVILNNEYGEQAEEELLLGGKNVRVTNENVITYIHLVANHRLNFQIRQQSTHFLRGFQQLIQKDWIDMFNEHELQLLISGSVDGFDIDDLRAHTQYTGGYHKDHYVIEVFWEVIKNFSLDNQRKFLKFVTGCSRGPLLGFKYLEPQFCVQRAAGSASEETLDRLPTSATCMNLLKLPPYRSKEQMEQKLLYAINAAAGFDLS